MLGRREVVEDVEGVEDSRGGVRWRSLVKRRRGCHRDSGVPGLGGLGGLMGD